MWEVFGDQGLQWHTVQLEISNAQGKFQYVFISQHGYQDIGVAIDNVNLNKDICANIPGELYMF